MRSNCAVVGLKGVTAGVYIAEGVGERVGVSVTVGLVAIEGVGLRVGVGGGVGVELGMNDTGGRGVGVSEGDWGVVIMDDGAGLAGWGEGVPDVQPSRNRLVIIIEANEIGLMKEWQLRWIFNIIPFI